MRAWAASLLIALATAAAHAQIPRTPDGHPDFQGVWSAAWITPLERPPEIATLVVPPAQVDQVFDAMWKRTFDRDGIGPLHSRDVRSLLRVGGEARSSLIVDPPDGKLPLAPAARARLGGGPPAVGFDGPEQRGISERCLSDGNTVAPFLVLPAGNMKQIVQTRDHLTVLSETMGSLRIIPIGEAIGQAAAGRGHWEGDALVVETSGFAPNDRIRVGPTLRFPISPKSKIIERFTRSTPDEIVYRFSVEDPDLYTRPWTAETAFRRSNQRVYEWGCQEANYALVNMLMGARMAEQKAAKAK